VKFQIAAFSLLISSGVVTASLFYISLTFVHSLLSLRLLQRTSIGASMFTSAEGSKTTHLKSVGHMGIGPTPARVWRVKAY
jgi:hypothetical protein